MNFMLIMKNEKSDLMAIGRWPLEYQAAVLRTKSRRSSDWTSVGIARSSTEAQAREPPPLPGSGKARPGRRP